MGQLICSKYLMMCLNFNSLAECVSYCWCLHLVRNKHTWIAFLNLLAICVPLKRLLVLLLFLTWLSVESCPLSIFC